MTGKADLPPGPRDPADELPRSTPNADLLASLGADSFEVWGLDRDTLVLIRLAAVVARDASSPKWRLRPRRARRRLRLNAVSAIVVGELRTAGGANYRLPPDCCSVASPTDIRIPSPGSYLDAGPRGRHRPRGDQCGDWCEIRRPVTEGDRAERKRIMKGAGRAVFVAILLLIIGTLNIIYGFAAIGNAHFFNNTQYVFSSLHTWGWITVIVGVIQLTGGFSLMVGGGYGRLIGIISAIIGAFESLLSVGGTHPWWSLAIFALCIYVLHGLLILGEEEPVGA